MAAADAELGVPECRGGDIVEVFRPGAVDAVVGEGWQQCRSGEAGMAGGVRIFYPGAGAGGVVADRADGADHAVRMGDEHRVPGLRDRAAPAWGDRQGDRWDYLRAAHGTNGAGVDSALRVRE